MSESHFNKNPYRPLSNSTPQWLCKNLLGRLYPPPQLVLQYTISHHVVLSIYYRACPFLYWIRPLFLIRTAKLVIWHGKHPLSYNRSNPSDNFLVHRGCTSFVLISYMRVIPTSTVSELSQSLVLPP